MLHKRRKFISQLAGIGGLAAISPVHAAQNPTKIKNIRLSQEDGQSRLVFDLDSETAHKLFTLHNPERVVVDLNNTRLTSSGLLDNLNNDLLKGVRAGIRNGHDLRIVLDLNRKAQPSSFNLRPSGDQGYRLVVDVKDPHLKHETSKPQKKLRDLVVAIDPGHGGKDPGATGRLGTHEKDVTLQIARKLAKVIDQQPGMKSAMVRSSDRFMHLRDRIKKARDLNADLMVSIHADSFPDKRARGASVYALSVSGASSETARLLAEKENNVDVLFGNVDLNDKDEMVAKVLVDLSLTGTIESSLDVGGEVIREIGSVGRVHKKKVQQAAFAVLKTPNIPAILVETAFISNPKEERKLRSSAHQAKVANAILRGINDYFVRRAPPGTWLSQEGKPYTIRKGDTLADLSEKFNTPVNQIRSRNALRGDQLQVGQKLIIPVS